MNINLQGSCNTLSYGLICLNILKTLKSLGHTIAYWPIGNPQVFHKTDAEIVKEAIDLQGDFDYNAPSLKIWHQFSLGEHIGKGIRINYSFFELDKFNPREKHHIESSDLFLVASNWAREIVCKETKLNRLQCRVVPLGVDTSIFYPGISKYNFKDDPENFVFFTAGKLEKRKSHDILVELFNNAFTKEDKVELWMFVDNPFLNEQESNEWRQLYLDSSLGKKIKFFPKVGLSNEVAEIMRATDAGIYISKAEGFDMSLLEMMACGKPNIVTNYSAHTEFCNKDNSLLIDIEETETAYDGKWFHGNGNWAKIGSNQKEQIIEKMRFLYHNRGDSIKEISKNAMKTAMDMTWEHTTRNILRKIEGFTNEDN